MKDKDFLLWVHERLQAFGDNRSYDFMHKLKAIADGTPEDRDTNWTPNNGVSLWWATWTS